MENVLEGVPGSAPVQQESRQGISQEFMAAMDPTIKDPTEQDQEQQQETPPVDEVSPPDGVAPDQPTEVVEVIPEAPVVVLGESNRTPTPQYEVPENLNKLVDFMQETSGTIEDYINLNKDMSEMDEKSVLREYYKSKSPHLDSDDVTFMMDKKFSFDAESDEEDEIRSKKIAFKEELYDAKKHLEAQKDKYYAEIKTAGSASGPDLVAQAKDKELSDYFNQQTDQFFGGDFKGFDFNLGEGKPNLRYKIDNADAIKQTQSDLTNVVGEFLDKDGKVKDAGSYHKAVFMMRNGEKVAQLMYDQGYATAVEELTKNSKNTDFTPQHNEVSSNTKLAPGQAREITQDNASSGPRIQSRFIK